MAVFNDIEQTVVEFGNGDIGVGGFINKNKEEGIITFTNIEKQEIGTSISTEESAPNLISSSDIYIIFKNTKSIDVVIKALNIIKDNMIGE